MSEPHDDNPKNSTDSTTGPGDTQPGPESLEERIFQEWVGLLAERVQAAEARGDEVEAMSWLREINRAVHAKKRRLEEADRERS